MILNKRNLEENFINHSYSAFFFFKTWTNLKLIKNKRAEKKRERERKKVKKEKRTDQLHQN